MCVFAVYRPSLSASRAASSALGLGLPLALGRYAIRFDKRALPLWYVIVFFLSLVALLGISSHPRSWRFRGHPIPSAPPWNSSRKVSCHKTPTAPSLSFFFFFFFASLKEPHTSSDSRDGGHHGQTSLLMTEEPWSSQWSDLCGDTTAWGCTMASKERLYEVWMLYCSKVTSHTVHAHTHTDPDHGKCH